MKNSCKLLTVMATLAAFGAEGMDISPEAMDWASEQPSISGEGLEIHLLRMIDVGGPAIDKELATLYDLLFRDANLDKKMSTLRENETMGDDTLVQFAAIKGRYNLLQVMAARNVPVSPGDVVQCILAAERGESWEVDYYWERMARLIACVAGKTATSSQGAKGLVERMLQDINRQASIPTSNQKLEQKHQELLRELPLIRETLQKQGIIPPQ